MTPVSQAERPWLEHFLQRYREQAMFPLVNLRDFGLGDHAPRAMHVWRTHDPDGALCLTTEGMLMPVLPEAGPAQIADAMTYLRGRRLIGAVGVTAEVESCLATAGVARAPRKIGAPEPHLSLDLAHLKVPPHGNARLIPLAEADRDLMIRWRTAYVQEVLGETAGEAPARAAGDIAAYLTRNSHRVLLVDDRPVAMTGFNAALPEIVQIGGVFTPPELRNRGYARMALASHLAEARAAGVHAAVLFAGSTAATRAYLALGFRQIGDYSVVLFTEPVDV